MKTYEEREKVEAFNYFKKMKFQAKLIENNSEVCILDWRAKRTFNLSARFRFEYLADITREHIAPDRMSPSAQITIRFIQAKMHSQSLSHYLLRETSRL